MAASQRARAYPASLPAPTGGWNARDALGDMPPEDAVTLTNFFPRTTDVTLRNGYSQFATGLPGQTETLMNYSGGSSNKLFAISSSSIYDITSGGAVGAASVTGLTNSRFQYSNIATAGGNFMLAVNGADKLQGFNGTTWWVDGDGTHDITGFNTATASNICLFKNRIWFCENGTLNAWYLGVNSISGAATAFALQSVASKGGYIMAMGTWTLDAGYGVDDYAVFVTSEGEVIVYRMTDPTSASSISLIGVWNLGTPVGRRCLMKYAGDLLIICQDGLLPLAAALQSSRLNPKVALSNKIQSAVSSAISSYSSNFGWQTAYFPKENMLFLNVPISIGSIQQQYVMNTLSGAWCNFSGWEANCWEIYQDNPYFGGNGFVGKAWDTLADNSTNISGTAKQAFNYFKSYGVLKRWTMMRPILTTNGNPALLANLDVDFSDDTPTAALNFSPTGYAGWDSAVWDTGVWGGGLNVLKNWQGVNGIGYCCAPRLQVASQAIEVNWVSTDLVMERGGIL